MINIMILIVELDEILLHPFHNARFDFELKALKLFHDE